MRRREFIALVGGAAATWPLTVRAQRLVKIELLNTGGQSSGDSTFFNQPFMRELEELGYWEGKNLIVERRFAEGNTKRLDDFAAELVRQQVDVIVTVGTPAGFAAKKATSGWRSCSDLLATPMISDCLRWRVRVLPPLVPSCGCSRRRY